MGIRGAIVFLNMLLRYLDTDNILSVSVVGSS